MIDFACKKLDLDEVMRCGLGITKTEFNLINFMLKEDWLTAYEIAKKLRLSLATTQRSLKKLHEKKLIERHQQNLDKGGYLFVYKAKNKDFIKEELRIILLNWLKNVETSLNKW